MRLPVSLQEPDHFDALTEFLRRRGLLRAARMLMALTTASSAMIPLSILVRPPSAAYTLVVGAVGALLAVTMTWFWLTRWPTRRQSMLAALGGTGCAVAWCLVQPSPALAAMSCSALAVTGAYVALFHDAKTLLVNSVAALAVAIVVAIRLVGHTELATALAAFWLIWLLDLVLPLAILGTSRAMTRYATRAEEDPLTGLLNRRGFFEAVDRRIGAVSEAGAHLVVMMIDLDHFKKVNDSYGHAAGDRMLRLVADVLRAHTPTQAMICRAGGEEFLVALVAGTPDVSMVTAELCDGIRTRCAGVTASIGVASMNLAQIRGLDVLATLEALIRAADVAMYRAKVNGGDCVEVGGNRAPYDFAREHDHHPQVQRVTPAATSLLRRPEAARRQLDGAAPVAGTGEVPAGHVVGVEAGPGRGRALPPDLLYAHVTRSSRSTVASAIAEPVSNPPL